VETHRVPVNMPFQPYESFIDFILTKMSHMIALTEDMRESEVAELQEAMKGQMKGICPSAPGRLSGVVVVGIAKK